MAEEEFSAVALRGYHFYPHPTSKTLGVLRFDTEPGPQFYLVTRKILVLLIESLQKHVDDIAPLQ